MNASPTATSERSSRSRSSRRCEISVPSAKVSGSSLIGARRGRGVGGRRVRCALAGGRRVREGGCGRRGGGLGRRRLGDRRGGGRRSGGRRSGGRRGGGRRRCALRLACLLELHFLL